MGLSEIVNEIARAAELVPEACPDAIIAEITGHRRIFVYGAGRTGLMLKAFAMRLMQTGKTVYVVGETITPSIEAGDLLIAASASGETVSVLDMVRQALHHGADVLTITGTGSCPLAELAKPCLVIETGNKYRQHEASGPPMGSLFEQMLLLVCDAVIWRMTDREDALEHMAGKHANLE